MADRRLTSWAIVALATAVLPMSFPTAPHRALPLAAAVNPSPSVAGPAQPRDTLGLELVGQIGGRVTAITIAGNYAYLGQGARLVVAAYQPPLPPLPLGQAGPLGERIADVAVVDGLAYVAAGYDGLQIVDVSDPTAPRRLGGIRLNRVTTDLEEYTPAALRVSVSGSLAAVTTDDHLQWIDVSDPAAPRVIGLHRNHLDWPDSVRDAVLVGHHALVAQSEDGLVVLDLTDPTTPTEAFRLAHVRPRAMDVVGDLAFVALEEPAGLLVLDISNPGALEELARLRLAQVPSDVWVADGRAYLAHGDAANGLGYAHYVPSGAVTIVDVFDPHSPQILGLIPLDKPGDYAALAFADNFAVVGSASGQLRTVDLTDFHGLEVLGTHAPGWFHTEDVAIQEGWLFALDGYGQLQILSVADDGEPGAARTFAPGFAATVMAVADDRVYLARRGGGLAVVDVADPLQPRVMGTLEATWQAEDLAAEGPLVAVAAGAAGLRVVDATDPARPVEVAQVADPAPALAVGVANRHAHVAFHDSHQPRGIDVLDLTDPAHPRRVATYANDLFVFNLALSEGRAVVDGSTATSTDLLDLYDVRTPATPQRVGSVELPDRTEPASHLDLNWPLAAVVSYHDLHVVDLTDPESRRWHIRSDSWPSFYGVALGDGFAYAGHAWARGYTVADWGGTDDSTGGTSAQRSGDPGAWTLERRGSLAYVVSDRGDGGDLNGTLEVVDLTDPASPRLVQRWYAGGPIADLERVGDQLAVLGQTPDSGEAQLDVLEIDDAGAIRPRSRLVVPDARLGRARAAGVRVWLTGAGLEPTTRGLLVGVSLADPDQPAELGRHALPAHGYDLAIADGRAYILTASGLEVVDIGDPAAIRPLGSWSGTSLGQRLAASGGWVFATTRRDGHLLVLDARDPADIRLAAELEVPETAEVLTLAADRLYLGSDYEQYLGVVDVADPTHPYPLWAQDPWRANDAIVSGDQAWLATGITGLVLLDLTEADHVPPVQETQLWHAVSGIARAGSLVAVAAGTDGLRLVSFADPAQPAELAAVPGLEARDVAFVADHAYVAAGPDGLVVLDVSEPRQPREVARVAVVGAAQVVVREKLVHVMADAGGLTLLDADNPAAPVVLGRLDGDAANGRLAVAADGWVGVTSYGQVLDLASPVEPRLASELPMFGPGDDAALVGRRAYMLDYGVYVYDLSEPEQPRIVEGDGQPRVGRGTRLATSGQWLFVGDKRGSLTAHDLSDPDQVAWRGVYWRGPALAPVGDPFGDPAWRPVHALHAALDAVLVGGANDGLWWLRRVGPVAGRWPALLPLALRGVPASPEGQ